MELDPRVLAFLQEPHIPVLATRSPSGRPQATPVWYLYEDGLFLVNTRRGRAKLRNIQADPRVALTILDRHDPYRYVQVLGRVGRFDPHTGPHDIDRLSRRYTGQPWTYPPGDSPAQRVSVYIRPERVLAYGL
jgi:PPOX class probable F420-dependent enzyme